MSLNRSREDHLQPEELAELLERNRQMSSSLGPTAPGSPLGSIPSSWGSDLHPHLAQCLSCRERLQTMSAFDAQLESLRSDHPAAAGGDCPDPDVWRQIAVALTPSDQALVHLQHASRCDHCGPLLRVAIDEMDGKITESEAKQIAALESARPKWQQKLASRITGTSLSPTPAPWWKEWVTVPRLALAGVSLAAVIAAGSWFAVRQAHPAPPADLLASAYSEQRPFEMRIPGASYGPVRIQRGAERSFASRPAALLKAEAIIADQIGTHASDPNWLQAKARADLLEGKYDPAVETLRHALQIEPKSSSLLIDLGTAYFQRALMADRQEDLGAAYESLSQALAAQPDNSVALFNRAIVAEHQFLYHQAVDDWDHYLRVDPGSEWAVEARQRADALRGKLKDHDQSHAAPLLSPSQIAAQVSSPELRGQIDQRVEEYLHEAVVSWLPQAFPDNQGTPDPSATQALFFLADLTAQQHGDRWLTDLLAGSSSPNFSQGVGALALALKTNDAGDYDQSSKESGQAREFFARSGNTAGVLYADFEQVYSEQFLRHTGICSAKAAAAENESEKYPYWWIQIQLGLERAVCSSIAGDIGGYEKHALLAKERARRAGYGAVFLRAVHFLADNRSETGDEQGASSLIIAGLAGYWSGHFPAARGYNLYATAGEVAETTARPKLSLALWNEAVELIRSDQNLEVRAGIYSEAARAAESAGQPMLAGQYYEEASRLYTAVPQSDAVRAYRLYSQIAAAQLESRMDRSDAAMGRLTSIQEDVHRLSESFLVELFYSALGQVQLSRRHYAEAEQALRPALLLAEQNLSSLRSEEERIKWRNDAAPIYLSFAEAKLAQGQTEESLEVLERYMGASRRTGRSDSQGGTPDLSQVASRLPLLSRETVIAYGLLPDGLAIWAYDNRGVTGEWFPGKGSEVVELSSRLDELASDPSSDLRAFHRDARSLYKLLITPIERRLEAGRTIVVEADNSLAKVPFESLVDSSGRYLLERAPVVYSPGMYVADSLQPSVPISADSSTLVLASAAGSSENGLAPLPDVGSEAETVASYFHEARILSGREATLAQAESGLRSATVFHFAGHALANTQETGLVLQDRDPQSGRLRLLNSDALRSVKSQNLQLAVLSACDTANGGKGDSSGLSNMSLAFLRAGVPHVVASRWAVESAQTRGFVGDFYRNVLSGTSVPEAVRVASLKMLANPPTTHPYYWSAFAAYGRP